MHRNIFDKITQVETYLWWDTQNNLIKRYCQIRCQILIVNQVI